MVVRGGYGLAYFPGNYMSQSLMKNPPFVSSLRPGDEHGASGRHAEPVGCRTACRCRCRPTPSISAGTIIGVEQDFKIDARAAVQRDRREGVRRQRGLGWLRRLARRQRRVRGSQHRSGAGRRPGTMQPRRRFYAQLPSVTTIGMFASDFESTLRRAAAGVPAPPSQRPHVQHQLHAGAHDWTQPTPKDVNIIERFDADFDVRHRIVVLGQLRAAVRADRSPASPGTCLAGWQVNGVASWQSRPAVQRHQSRPRDATPRGRRSAQSGRRSRRSTIPTHRAVVQHRRVFERSRSTPSATPGAQHPARPAAAAAGSLVFQRLCADGDAQASDARRGLQHHQHTQLREPDRPA